MTLNPKILDDLERINNIEINFHRDLVSLLYSPFVFGHLFEKSLCYQIKGVNKFEQIWNWYVKIKAIEIPQNLDKLRLGQYAEALLLFFFSNSTSYKTISNNLQLINEKITVGEIDFLLEEFSSEQKIHLELAIKFYLKIKVNEEVQWIGPSSKDRLLRKKDKLLNHQLQLAKNYNSLLPNEFQHLNFKPQLLLKGAEFILFKDYKPTENPIINCWWIHFNQMNQIIENSFQYKIVPIRRDWITPFNSRLTNLSIENFSAQITTELESKNEILIVRFNSKGQPNDRGFIVRDNWPFLDQLRT